MLTDHSSHGGSQQLQRLDPLMILWPVLFLGIIGVGSVLLSLTGLILRPVSLGESDSIIDAFVYAQIGTPIPLFLVAITGFIGLFIGYNYYNHLGVRTNDDQKSPIMQLNRRTLVSVLVYAAIMVVLQTIFGFPNGYGPLPERFLAELFRILIGSAFSVIGLGIVSDYYDLAALAHAKNSHVEVFAVWKSKNPSLIRKTTDLFGGIFLMLYDPRVRYALFKIVENPQDYRKERSVSPDEVRREQHLQM